MIPALPVALGRTASWEVDTWHGLPRRQSEDRIPSPPTPASDHSPIHCILLCCVMGSCLHQFSSAATQMLSHFSRSSHCTEISAMPTKYAFCISGFSTASLIMSCELYGHLDLCRMNAGKV